MLQILTSRTKEGRAPRLRAVRLGVLSLVLAPVAFWGCWDSSPTEPNQQEGYWDLAECDLDPTYLANGGTGFDGIPSISGPVMVDTTNHDYTDYLQEEHRVVGLIAGGQPLAFPLSALWFHEIVNVDWGGQKLVVTHASLSGSSRVFKRSAAGDADFGVSGFLYQNNLLFFDRAEAPSLWAQLTGDARCGPYQGLDLLAYPFLEMTWAGWKTLYPNTLVLSVESSGARAWGTYPYGNYEGEENFFFAEQMPELDPRLPPKERVLGIPGQGEDGVAFSFGSFEEAGSVAVGHGEVGGRSVVAFWRGDLEGAAAYWAEAQGQDLTFTVLDGTIVDQQTGTTWSFLGVGSGGEMNGVQLEPVTDAAVSYWGAWAAFYPDTEIGEIG